MHYWYALLSVYARPFGSCVGSLFLQLLYPPSAVKNYIGVVDGDCIHSPPWQNPSPDWCRIASPANQLLQLGQLRPLLSGVKQGFNEYFICSWIYSGRWMDHHSWTSVVCLWQPSTPAVICVVLADSDCLRAGCFRVRSSLGSNCSCKKRTTGLLVEQLFTNSVFKVCSTLQP